MKHPFCDLALKFRTGLMLFKLHGEKRLLFFLSPEVALANIMKLPSSPPGEHCSGSCCNRKQIRVKVGRLFIMNHVEFLTCFITSFTVSNYFDRYYWRKDKRKTSKKKQNILFLFYNREQYIYILNSHE